MVYLFCMVNYIMRVFVADVLEQRTQQRLVVGESAGGDLLRDPLAEDAAEVVVAHERK